MILNLRLTLVKGLYRKASPQGAHAKLLYQGCAEPCTGECPALACINALNSPSREYEQSPAITAFQSLAVAAGGQGLVLSGGKATTTTTTTTT
eukprot:CAMPEP_0177437020 /NCGR_PEP_ID=MMETSP0369-20130122/1965_1 /TAXON_ID=447022 ORGANISM="Scrippsiella hangoei-like, Strain SHHI-4" /NCGR_SAMPLE_ID=MMETSP0369 /ASSEMBLY_ACC=CAM_ASM_000364 /LENGTH=92 /DNA_ID=CAMNT_0018908425 /DNA_START=132 /DNA_END=407 /DNA_ORIENTATION=+